MRRVEQLKGFTTMVADRLAYIILGAPIFITRDFGRISIQKWFDAWACSSTITAALLFSI